MQATSLQSDTPDRKTPALRIDRDVVLAHRDAEGISSNALLAERIGVDESTLQRVLAHTVEPSGRFISGLLKALPRARFEELFDH